MPDIAATRPATGAPVDTPWGQQVHDMLEGIQGATTTATVTAVARFDVTVTFPRPYASPPMVVIGSAGGSVYLAGLVSLPTTTSCIVGLFRRDGANLTAGVVAYSWLAMGTLA